MQWMMGGAKTWPVRWRFERAGKQPGAHVEWMNRRKQTKCLNSMIKITARRGGNDDVCCGDQMSHTGVHEAVMPGHPGLNSEAVAEVPPSCIHSNCQQGAMTMFAKKIYKINYSKHFITSWPWPFFYTVYELNSSTSHLWYVLQLK